MAQSFLEYIIRSKKEGDAAQQSKTDLEQLEQQAQKTSASGEMLGKAWTAVQGAMIAGGVALLASVPALLDQGIAIEKAENALIGYTGSAEEAERVIRAVESAAGGSITQFEATQNASRLFAMGLATTADEAAKLTKMAITLGAAMGEDASSSFENFSLLLANQSIPRLDTFGISGAAVRERMAELTDEIEGLDRQTAFMMATMELGTAAMEDLEAAGFQATDNVGRLKTELGNLKDQLAVTVANGLMPIIDGAYALKDAVNEQKDSIVANSKSYDDYLERLEKLKEDHPILFAGTDELTRAQWAQNRATIGLTEETLALAEQAEDADLILQNYGGTQQDLREDIDGTTGATEDLTGATDDLVFSIGKVTQAKLAQEALEALSQAYQDGEVDANTYQQATEAVLTGLLGYTTAEAKANTALTLLIADYEETGGSALELYGQILALNGEIAATPRDINVTYHFHTTGRRGGDIPGEQPPGAEPYQAGGQFIVTGPAGLDNIPVSFMASRNEVVTITPQGRPTPQSSGGLTIDARGAQFFGVGGIQEFADQILPQLENAMRYG